MVALHDIVRRARALLIAAGVLGALFLAYLVVVSGVGGLIVAVPVSAVAFALLGVLPRSSALLIMAGVLGALFLGYLVVVSATM